MSRDKGLLVSKRMKSDTKIVKFNQYQITGYMYKTSARIYQIMVQSHTSKIKTSNFVVLHYIIMLILLYWLCLYLTLEKYQCQSFFHTAPRKPSWFICACRNIFCLPRQKEDTNNKSCYENYALAFDWIFFYCSCRLGSLLCDGGCC